ncbi:MAG TPA: hypothetical protein VF041_05360 [Gemmatimonadaceae bacterium]
MRSAVRLLVGAMLGVGAVGAVACHRKVETQGAEAPSNARTTVKVENQGFADMTIYVLSGGQRIRLGLATGNQTSTFTIPSFLVGGLTPLRFLADPVGSSRAPVSDEITVKPGDEVTLTIPPS